MFRRNPELNFETVGCSSGTHFDVEPTTASGPLPSKPSEDKAGEGSFLQWYFALMPRLTELKGMVRAGAIRFNNSRVDGTPTFVYT